MRFQKIKKHVNLKQIIWLIMIFIYTFLLELPFLIWFYFFWSWFKSSRPLLNNPGWPWLCYKRSYFWPTTTTWFLAIDYFGKKGLFSCAISSKYFRLATAPEQSVAAPPPGAGQSLRSQNCEDYRNYGREEVQGDNIARSLKECRRKELYRCRLADNFPTEGPGQWGPTRTF